MSIYQLKYASELEFELNALVISIENITLIEEKSENTKLIQTNNLSHHLLLLRNKMLAKNQAEAYFEFLNKTIELLKNYLEMQADNKLPFENLSFICIHGDERLLINEYYAKYKQYLHTTKADIFNMLQNKNLLAQAENISNLNTNLKNIQAFHHDPATFKMETLIASIEKTKNKSIAYIGIALAIASTVTAFLGAFMVMLPVLAVLVLPMAYLTYNLYNQYQANKPENKYALPKGVNSKLVELRTTGYGVAGLFRKKNKEEQVVLVQAQHDYSPKSA